jgi:hypothetical protein
MTITLTEAAAIRAIAQVWQEAREAINADPLDAVSVGTQAIDMLEGMIRLVGDADPLPAGIRTRCRAAATVAQARIQSLMADVERRRAPTHRASHGAGILR